MTRHVLTGAALVLIACGLPARADDPEPLDRLGRRVIDGPPIRLGFRNVTVEQLVPFIAESTGKVVIPHSTVLTRRVTLVNDREVPRATALDLVLTALQQIEVGVVETALTITLRDIAEIKRQDVPVIGPDESVMDRPDLGGFVEKVFRVRHSDAKRLGDAVKPALPDYAFLTIDESSNQIAVLGNVALLQRVERLIESLDRPSAAALVTETFHLRFADAQQVASNIKELFPDAGSAQRRQAQAGTDRTQRFFFGPGGAGGTDQTTPAGTAAQDVRVTANAQQNAVTVVAEPAVLDHLRRIIREEWDRPLPDEAVVPRIYELRNSDPVKVADMLTGLFGQPTGTSQPGSAGAAQGVGRLAGQFSFQAVPDAGRLVVVARSPDNLAVIDRIVEGLDQPQTIGLPAIVELRHASAEELAEQLNTLLAQDGTLAQIRRSESGLTQASATASPFAQAQQTTQQQDTTQVTADVIAFWWQRSRPPTDSRGPSNLISNIRIVPVWRQNALMVLSPPEYRQSMVDLIERLDRPGRQVLISAIVAEVSREDATALGLRWSSANIAPTSPDNAFTVGAGASGQENNFLGSLFDTSVLDVSANLNLILQALAQKTSVSILSEPRVFTSDNQEAEFFSGQDIPFVTDSQTTDQGSVINSFDYRAVGIQLRVRPRITPNRNVDLRVNLELSSIVPGETLFGGFIVDRRETTTQLIVHDGQTIVISGILRNEVSDIVRKVPLLGDIPLLGALFRSREKSTTSAELLVFITPLVVDNAGDLDRVNQPFRRRLEERRGETPEAPGSGAE